MQKVVFLTVLVFTILTTACGGSGGNGNSPRAEITCNTFEGTVFIDGVCSPWQDVSAYEQLNQSPWTGYEITDGSPGNAVTFTIVHSLDEGHHQVLDVVYADDTNYSAAIRIRAPDDGTTNSIDMSEYAGGKLRFDIKLIDAGIESSDLELVIECISFCGSTPKIIKPVALGEWQTFELSVADLIDRGLDIKKVSLGFMLSPTWSKQAGVHFQVDNIRWIKGELPEPTQEVCYANHFGPTKGEAITLLEIKGESFDISSEQSFNMLNMTLSNLNIVPDWSTTKGLWVYGLSEPYVFETGEFLNESNFYSCSSRGVLSMDVYVSRGLVNDGKVKFRLVLIDSSGEVHDISDEDIMTFNMMPNEWNRISVNLSAEAHIDNIRYIGLRIDSSEVGDDVDGGFAIDNVLIKHSVSN